MDGWPKITGSWIYGPPSVGDINGDGLLDIVAGDQTLSITPVNKVYAWTGSTGDTLEGFPIIDIFGVNSQIILADLDGDGEIELMFDDNVAINSKGRYQGYNHDGTPMEYWPIETLGSTFFINPMVVDIDFDGILDISGGGSDEGSGNTHIYLWNSHAEYNHDLAILPVLQYNTRHNGVYGDIFMVGTPEVSDIVKFEWTIFPNPSQRIINFKFLMLNSGKDYSLNIYDISGRMLKEINIPGGQKEVLVSIEDFKQGMYTFLLKEGYSVFRSGKFVICR